jgi:HAD superfamily hydrolase (TIGR01450 family)
VAARLLPRTAIAPTLRAVSIDLSTFDAVLLDLDGTVYHEEHALPGAVELIHRLQQEGKPFACLTNSTSSPQRIVARLARMNIVVDAAHVYTAAAAATDYVLDRFGGPGRLPRVFNCSTEGVHEMLDGRVQWVNKADESCDAVICGVPLNVFATLDRQRIAMLLLRAGAALVAICADRVYPSPRGLEFGVGAMAAMLAYASGATPIDCGKPQPLFFQELCRRLHVEPQNCVLIGDNLESDIAGGKSVQMKTVLMLGGVSSRQDAEALPPERRPDWIINDLREL